MPRGVDTSRHPNRQVGKVIIVSPAREMTPEETEAHNKWLASTNLQERYENMDRRINFPLERF